MALTIYGSPRSRTMRTLWIAEELGIEYRHVSVAWEDPWLKSDEFRRVNPFGAVPAIDHDGYCLGESLAINLYLAKTFGSVGPEPLYPPDGAAEADAWRWTLWAQGHLEPWVRRDGGLPVYSGAALEVAMAEAQSALNQLDKALAHQDWLGGPRFTIADLNVACVLSPSRWAPLQLDQHARTYGWLQRCYGRPAARAVRERFA
ncbi:MAG: glutathione S-transferase family protein [Phenylobacterium sp.]|nr:glutathione S-transferase family protein [Phenylobacterium sp.]